MDKRAIVITGMGLLTPLGEGVEKNWGEIKALKTGISRYLCEGSPDRSFQYMGKVSHFNLPSNDSQKLLNQMKFLNRGAVLGLVAADEAIQPIRSDILFIPPERRALYIGTGDHTKTGCEFMFPAIEEATAGKHVELDYGRLNKACLNKVNPFFLLEALHNNPFSFLSAFFEFKGTNACLASDSPCGTHALELAFRSIRRGEADVALAVGCGNWITEMALYEMERIGLLSKCKEGSRSFRPFDKQRDGFIAGEGAAALLLETEEAAVHRGAKIFAEVMGMGNCMEFSNRDNLDLPHQISRRSIQMALKEGDTDVDDLAFVLPHGNATVEGDRSELESIQSILDEKVFEIPVCGMKPYTGHLGAASDIAEIILGIKAVKEGIVPATPNFQKTEEPFPHLKISASHLPCSQSQFLSLSYGMGGQSSAVLLKV